MCEWLELPVIGDVIVRGIGYLWQALTVQNWDYSTARKKPRLKPGLVLCESFRLMLNPFAYYY